MKTTNKNKESLSASDKRRDQILDAACIVFAKDGFANAKTDTIAKKAGLGKGTIYRYFKNKETLFLAIADKGLNKLRDCMSSELMHISDPIEKIKTAIKTYLSYFEDNPIFVDIMVHEHSDFKERIQKKYFEHYYGKIDRIRKTFEAGIKEGLIKDIDINSTITMLTSILHGLVYAWHVEGKSYKLTGKIPTIYKVFFTGILVDAEKAKYE